MSSNSSNCPPKILTNDLCRCSALLAVVCSFSQKQRDLLCNLERRIIVVTFDGLYRLDGVCYVRKVDKT